MLNFIESVSKGFPTYSYFSKVFMTRNSDVSLKNLTCNYFFVEGQSRYAQSVA